MGEYIQHNGQKAKIGTCENLDLTYDQAKRIMPDAEKVPGNLQPMLYVHPKYSWRYKFPSGSEGDEWPTGLPASCSFPLPTTAPLSCLAEEHGATYHHFSGRHGAYNVNVRIECPWKTGHPHIGSSVPFTLVQQKLMHDGSLWPIIQCDWCGEKWRVPPDDGEWIAQHLDGLERPRIAKTIRDGYAKAAPQMV